MTNKESSTINNNNMVEKYNAGSRTPMSKGTMKFIAGSMSGAIASVLVQPLDVIKTRQQQGMIKSANEIAGKALIKYKTTLETFLTILREENLVGLWKGTAPTLYRIVPGAGINFFFLHHLTTFLNQSTPDKPLSPYNALLAGSAARTMSTIIMLPISVVKTRFEAYGTHNYKSTYDALRTIARTEGARGLFAGAVPSILRDAPFSGFYFLFYTQLQSKFHTAFTPNESRPGTMINLMAGAVAATIATIATHPQDMVKTRMQIGQGASMMEVFRGIWNQEGIRGLYKGLTPRLIRRPISNALTWAIYEEIVAFLAAKKTSSSM